MRIPPALLFLAALLIALSAAIVSGQTASKTIKICEGLPIPEGYTIIGTTTSPDCPKNTYLLKKDETADSDDQSSTPEASRVSETLRPRRVGSSAPSMRNGPAQPAPRQPPTLSGTTGVTRPPLQTAPAAPLKTGPEEVGDGDILHVDTTLVTVPVSVMDRNGKFIPNLRREDFHLFEDGVEQVITHFGSTEKPFTVALLLDTSGSMSFHLSDIKDAAIAFANQLRPDDRMLVATFNDQVLLLTPEATNNRALIRDVINYNAQTGDRTRLYDAVDLLIKERLNKIPGRKAIVLFTDGVDTASYLSSFESTTHEVEELDALIYPIQYDTYEEVRVRPNNGSIVTVNRSGWPFPRSSGSSVIIPSWPNGGRPPLGTSPAEYALADRYLHGLAEKTGARLYQANDTQQLTRAFSMIAEELRRQYTLSYYPKTPAQVAGERRQIKVRVSKPDLVVRARDNYAPNVPASTR